MQVFGQFEARDWRRRIIVLALVMILLIGLWRATKQQGGHVVPIPGARRAESITDCAKAADVVLSSDDVRAIENAFA